MYGLAMQGLPVIVALVGCSGPPGPSIALEPASPRTTDALQLVIEDSPQLEDDEVVTYRVHWFRDEQPMPRLLDATSVPRLRTDKGETWRAVVTPMDDEERLGQPVEASVTVLNSAPVVSVDVSPESPGTGSALQAFPSSSDADRDALDTRITWLRDGVDSGITGDTVPAAETARGETWTARVVVDDGEASPEAATADVTIVNTAPVADGVSIAPDKPDETSTLTAVPIGSDADGDMLNWSFVWEVQGVQIAGETLTGESFDKGDTVRLLATPRDAFGPGKTVRASMVIRNAPPTLAGAMVHPLGAREADTLSCRPLGLVDPDGDPVSFTTTWFVDEVPVSRNDTLDGMSFDKGDSVTCRLKPSDSEAEGAPVISEANTILNSPPVFLNFYLGPLGFRTLDDCIADVYRLTDDDGDLVTATYVWEVNGTRVKTEDVSVDTRSKDEIWGILDHEHHERDDKVRVTVTVTDGEDDGLYGGAWSSPASAEKTVANTPPSRPDIGIIPDAPPYPRDDEDIRCVLNTPSTDVDGDTVTYSVRWRRNGVVWTGATSTTSLTGDTIKAADTAVGDRWECTMRADDGIDYTEGVDATGVR